MQTFFGKSITIPSKSFVEQSATIQKLNVHLRVKHDIIDFTPYLSKNLAIDDLIRLNTSAEQELEGQSGKDCYSYDMVYTKLQKNLEKYL